MSVHRCCQTVVSAATAGEVTGTAKRVLIPDLDAANAMDALAVTTATRLLPSSSEHTRMLTQKGSTEFSGRQAEVCGQGDSGGGAHAVTNY